MFASPLLRRQPGSRQIGLKTTCTSAERLLCFLDPIPRTVRDYPLLLFLLLLFLFPSSCTSKAPTASSPAFAPAPAPHTPPPPPSSMAPCQPLSLSSCYSLSIFLLPISSSRSSTLLLLCCCCYCCCCRRPSHLPAPALSPLPPLLLTPAQAVNDFLLPMTHTVVTLHAGSPACIASRATARLERIVQAAASKPLSSTRRESSPRGTPSGSAPPRGTDGSRRHPAEGHRRGGGPEGAAAGPAPPPPAAAPVSGLTQEGARHWRVRTTPVRSMRRSGHRGTLAHWAGDCIAAGWL